MSISVRFEADGFCVSFLWIFDVLLVMIMTVLKYCRMRLYDFKALVIFLRVLSILKTF